MIKIITKNTYDDLLNQIKQGEDYLRAEIAYRKKKQKQADAEINELKQKNQILKIDNAALKDIQVMNEREIKKLNKKLKLTTETNEKLGNQKGGLTKENNKLKLKLDGKEQVIKEYEKAIVEAKKKNEMQFLKIQELTKNTNHLVQEYKENGLPKQTKEILKKVNKKGKKK